MVRLTSARPSGGRPELPAVPAKMTSSILPPRRLLAPCSPITHARASTTLDLPDPLGPTTAVMPGSKRSVVDEANDLKPRRVRLLRCTYAAPQARNLAGHDRIGAAKVSEQGLRHRGSFTVLVPERAHGDVRGRAD